MVPQRATQAHHSRRHQRTDLLGFVGHPILNSVPAKQRKIHPMAGRRHDFAAELPKKKISAAEAIFSQPFGACPFDCAPVQQIVRPQMKRAEERAMPGMLHHSRWEEAKHHPGYDFTVVACKKQPPIHPRSEELFLQLFFASDSQGPATCPVEVNGIIGRDVVTGFSKIDGNAVFLSPI